VTTRDISVPWTARDVLIVTLSVLAGGAVFYGCLLLLFGDRKVTFVLARYVGSALMIVVPLVWVRGKYGVSAQALGLRRGTLRPTSQALVGASIALAYSLLIQWTPLRYRPIPPTLVPSHTVLDVILLPLSITGFVTVVLVPVGEEILDRGFTYGWLREKVGVPWGLLVQALLFSMLHFSYNYDSAMGLFIHRFVLGLVLGTLYERTGSIYSPMICHAIINYSAIAIVVIR